MVQGWWEDLILITFFKFDWKKLKNRLELLKT